MHKNMREGGGELNRWSYKIYLIPVFATMLASTVSTMDTLVMAQSPAFNFSELASNLNSSQNMDFSKLLSSIKRISGPYSNPDFGFSIVFPSGWNGSEISFGGAKVATVSSPEDPASNAFPSVMGVAFVDNKNGSAISTLSNASKMIVDSGSSEAQASSQKPECKSTSVSQVKLNGINGEERVVDCTNVADIGGNAKIKVYALVTKDDSLLTLSFISSQTNYDKNLPIFEETVKSISLANPGDVANSASYNAYKNALNRDLK